LRLIFLSGASRRMVAICCDPLHFGPSPTRSSQSLPNSSLS